MTETTLRFLIIDDAPSRYDEFTRLLDRAGHTWTITLDPHTVYVSLPFSDVVLLDHDMPRKDGREWARDLAAYTPRPPPVIITSTTGLPQVREEMLATLTAADVPATLNPADHMGCEDEWLAWAYETTGYAP